MYVHIILQSSASIIHIAYPSLLLGASEFPTQDDRFGVVIFAHYDVSQ